MFSKIAILFLFSAPAVIWATPFTKCESNEPLPKLTQMLNLKCNNVFCEVRRGKPAVANMTIKADRPITSIHGKVDVLFRRRWWKLNIGQSKVCKHLTVGHCPLAPGDEVIYRGSLKIPKIARIGMKAPVRIRTIDQNKKVIACVKIFGKVVA